MKIFQKITSLLLITVTLFCFFAPAFIVKAEESLFLVYLDEGNQLLGSYATYQEAYAVVKEKEAETVDNNVLIYKDNVLRYVTYGIINFRIPSKDDPRETTSYTIEFNGLGGYTNATYGADGAFLGTNEDGTRVRFKQAGVIGWVNYDQIELINMNKQNYDHVFMSSYMMVYSDVWELRHNITTNVYSPAQGSALILGQERPYGMENNKYYSSYDGHYFYPDSLEGVRTMLRDYKNGVYTNAINADNPYYNYYQFLSNRSISNYTSAQIRQDFSGYTSKVTGDVALPGQSQLFGEETSFIQYQNEFGANAILMLGTAKNESSGGTSSISITKKNLFGHSAFDSSPGASAAGYVSVAQSIFAHAKTYISINYLDPCDGATVNGNGASDKCHRGKYYGGHVGDKNSGMNIKYASDPYWGEKAAKNYYTFDKRYGLQDYGKYSIGIKTSLESYPIKAEPNSSSSTLYTTGKSTTYPVLILSSVEGEEINGSNLWYKIQSDATLNSNRTGIVQDLGDYDYNHNIGYIHSSYLSFVRPGKEEKNRYTIKFNPNGGVFSDNIVGTKSLTVEEYVIPDINPPSKEGYRFIGWDKELVGATENVTYTAVYEPLITTYQITFNAALGTFGDGSKTKRIEVKALEVPTMEQPTLSGYIFVGWTPSVREATSNVTYTAQYKKIEEIEWKEADGEFYFDSLTSNDKGLEIKGYSTINGVSNDLNTKISFEIEFENVDNGKKISIPLNRITDENQIPFKDPSSTNNDFYSWFNGTISLNALDEGNYIAYIVTKSGGLYTRKLIRNLLGKPMIGNYEQGGKQIWIRNNYYVKLIPMEFFVRNKKIANKNNDPLANMITGYSKIGFDGNQLKIRGFAHNIGGDYAPDASVSRTIILENTKTYQTISDTLPVISNGDYMISLRVPDGFDKTKAWFDGGIDISSLEKGTYVIYIANTANVSDFAELNDIFNKTIVETATMNGKKYSLKVNSSARYRIELIVE